VKIWWSSFFFGLVTVGTARAILAMLGRDAGQRVPVALGFTFAELRRRWPG